MFVFSQVHIGNNIFEFHNFEAFMENFNTWKTKIDKCSKKLSGTIWTREQMRYRSLQGGQSNRFKNSAPKQKATPKKVSAVLGKNSVHKTCFLFASVFCYLLNHALSNCIVYYVPFPFSTQEQQKLCWWPVDSQILKKTRISWSAIYCKPGLVSSQDSILNLQL